MTHNEASSEQFATLARYPFVSLPLDCHMKNVAGVAGSKSSTDRHAVSGGWERVRPD